MSYKDLVHGFDAAVKEQRQELTEMIDDLLEIEENWNKVIAVLKIDYAKDFVMVEKRLEQLNKIAVQAESKQELVTMFSSEGDEYQKKLDQIDELALLIENAIKRIRGKI